MPSKKTTRSKNNIIADEIINLLRLDIDEIIENVKNNIKYELTSTDINDLMLKIDADKDSEAIQSNLYELNIREDIPDFLKCIYENYNNHLVNLKKSISRPKSYNTSTIDYIRALQVESFKKVQTAELNLNDLINETKEIPNQIDKKINDAKDKLITLTVTVLGIFCSLTFALSGSLSILNSVFDTNNTSFAESLFKFSLIGMFVANLVFLLIYCIARLNNKSLAMHCSKCTAEYNKICNTCDVGKKQQNKFQYTIECHGCEHRNVSCGECERGEHWWSVFCKLRNKFYYIYLINIICIIFLVTSTIMGLCGTPDFIFKHNIDNNEQNQQTSRSEILVTPNDINANVSIDVNRNIDVQQSESEQHNKSKTNDELTANIEQNTD